MKDVIEAIEEIQTILERQVEWALTDKVQLKTINPQLEEINRNLEQLKHLAEVLK